MRQRVLVVDDEESIRKLLKSRLERDGFQIDTASNADEAEMAFARGKPISVVVTDIKMPGRDGISLMKWIRDKQARTRTLVITGHGEKEVAIQALKLGASDYLEKPFDLDELSHSVRRAAHEFKLETENQDLVARLEARVERVEGKAEDQVWYVSKSKSMAKVNEWMTVLRREAMRGEAEEPTVLISGESGTGKEGIARMIHAGSRRGKGPWVAVNCANFSEQLLESELFGHERGAFTGASTMKRGLFEIAHGGTLFLDEVGEMDVKLQAKLLRVLQEKSYRRVGGTADLQADVRVIAATNRDLTQRVQAGAFREDLYHRINRVVIELPALRERRDDILAMARQFAERAYHSRGKTFEGFDPDAEDAMTSYSWPGNVRELLNVVERAALVSQHGGQVSCSDLSLPNSEAISSGADSPMRSPFSARHLQIVPESPNDGYMELKRQWADAFEREYLAAALAKTRGNVSAAAREARLDRSNFLRLLRRHGIKAVEYRNARDLKIAA